MFEGAPASVAAGWVARIRFTVRAADQLLRVIPYLRGGDLFKGKSNLASSARKQRSSWY